jgi:thiamine biosynthesis protein ThiI
MDKEEIIDLSRRIGTFETSILPYDDCCTIFSPDHPVVKPKLEIMRGSWSKLDADELIDEAVAKTEKEHIPPVSG